MGLDACMYKVSPEDAVSCIAVKNDDNFEEICYWRKFWALHAWMEFLYLKKGGTDRSFNCKYVQLTEEDLNKLKKECKDFDKSEILFEGDLEDLPSIIDIAKEEIKKGNCVYYYGDY